jgi:hypothetical protein
MYVDRASNCLESLNYTEQTCISSPFVLSLPKYVLHLITIHTASQGSYQTSCYSIMNDPTLFKFLSCITITAISIPDTRPLDNRRNNHIRYSTRFIITLYHVISLLVFQAESLISYRIVIKQLTYRLETVDDVNWINSSCRNWGVWCAKCSLLIKIHGSTTNMFISDNSTILIYMCKHANV